MLQQILDTLTPFLGPLLGAAAGKSGVVLAIITWMGVLRVVFKPLFTVLQAGAAATPSQNDDAALAKVEGSAIYKGVVWVLDFFGSIKIAPKA